MTNQIDATLTITQMMTGLGDAVNAQNPSGRRQAWI